MSILPSETKGLFIIFAALKNSLKLVKNNYNR